MTRLAEILTTLRAPTLSNKLNGAQARADSMTPDWFRIVKDYGFRVGPTIPFVLGAAVLRPLGDPPSAATGQKELHRLIMMMASETPDGYGVNIQWCDTTTLMLLRHCAPAIP